MGYVQGQAKATRDDPGEEIIKTEIEVELTQLENTISSPMATSSTQVSPQSVMQSILKNTSNESGEPTATPEIVKFIYSEKATKFCEISTLLLTGNT